MSYKYCNVQECKLCVLACGFTLENKTNIMTKNADRQPTSGAKEIVLLIHGIRTEADWQEMVSDELQKQQSLTVIPLRYGYFDIFRFVFPILTRSAPVEYIEKQLQIIRKLHPFAKISIIAHSFGTYVVARLLERNIDLTVNKLVLCGSVLPQQYPWHKVKSQITAGNVVNDCGKHDIWPVLAQCVTWGYGSSGTHGFGNAIIRDRFHDGGHGRYFTKDFVRKFWTPLFHEGRIEATAYEKSRPSTPYWVSLLGILPIKWIIAVVLFAAVAFSAKATIPIVVSKLSETIAAHPKLVLRPADSGKLLLVNEGEDAVSLEVDVCGTARAIKAECENGKPTVWHYNVRKISGISQTTGGFTESAEVDGWHAHVAQQDGHACA